MARTFYLMLLFIVAGSVAGDDFAMGQEGDRRERNTTNDKSNSSMTKAREAAALAFVREHHAELESLLIQLKESQPKQYESAVRDLFRTSEKLAALSEKDASRAKLELKAWQAKSRVQLLSATLLMTPSDNSTHKALKQALIDESQIRVQLLELERERTARRLDKIESQIESIGANAERTAERQIKQLLEGTRQAKPVKTNTQKVN